MNASGLIRALKYFIRYTEWYVFGTVAGSILMVAYICLIDADWSFARMQSSIPYTLLYFAVIILFYNGSILEYYWYSLPISFGCRRKNVFLGNLVMDLLFIIQILILYRVSLFAFSPKDETYIPLPFLFSVFLLIEGISKILGIFVLKFGKAGYVLFIISLIVICVGVGFFVGYSGVTDDIGIYLLQIGMDSIWVFLLAGIIVSASANILNYRTVSRYEIRS